MEVSAGIISTSLLLYNKYVQIASKTIVFNLQEFGMKY